MQETGRFTTSLRLPEPLCRARDQPRTITQPSDAENHQRRGNPQLDPTDRDAIDHILDGLITENRIRNAITQSS